MGKLLDFEIFDHSPDSEPVTEFDRDLADSMVSTSFDGHDPYNYVGAYVVAECIGVDL